MDNSHPNHRRSGPSGSSEAESSDRLWKQRSNNETQARNTSQAKQQKMPFKAPVEQADKTATGVEIPPDAVDAARLRQAASRPAHDRRSHLPQDRGIDAGPVHAIGSRAALASVEKDHS